MNTLLDNSVLIDNIENKTFEEGIILDLSFFERCKNVDMQTKITRINEIKDYVSKTNSTILSISGKDIFDLNIDCVNNLLIEVSNYLGFQFIMFCQLIALFYIYKINKISIVDGCYFGNKEVCFFLNSIINSNETMSQFYSNIGNEIYNNPSNFNKIKYEKNYVNLILDYYNSKVKSGIEINNLSSISPTIMKKEIDKNVSEHEIDLFVFNVFRFRKDSVNNSKVFSAHLKNFYVNNNKFEFNNIVDMCTIYTAITHNLKLATKDARLINIKKFLDFDVEDRRQGR